jgi:hypothetical protein
MKGVTGRALKSVAHRDIGQLLEEVIFQCLVQFKLIPYKCNMVVREVIPKFRESLKEVLVRSRSS